MPDKREHKARVLAVCGVLASRENISTHDLVERCWDDASARKHLYEVLKQADVRAYLAACWTLGKPREISSYGRKLTITPTVWHRPFKACPHCDGIGYLANVPAPEPETWTA